MAVIKTDPNQTKTVVALIAVLAVAVVYTIMRVGSSASPTPIKKTETASADAYVVKAAYNCDYTPARNPFQKPAAIRAAIDLRKTDHTGNIIQAMPGHNDKLAPWPVDKQVSIEPMHAPSESRKGEPKDNSAQNTEEVQKPKPTFTLMATIKDASGMSAVIKTGETETRVVGLGDKLEGGYWVTELNTSYAVLTDGRDTIIAKKPQS